MNGIDDWHGSEHLQKTEEVLASRFRQVVEKDNVKVIDSIDRDGFIDEGSMREKAMAILEHLELSARFSNPVRETSFAQIGSYAPTVCAN